MSIETVALMLSVFALTKFQMPEPPGPHIGLKPDELSVTKSFEAGQPIVGTYFFYWYDVYSNAHFINSDGSDALVDHPVSKEDFSYKSKDWWKKELMDVSDAGIDFILPVYWGYPDDYDSWSFKGLPLMVEAWDELAQEGCNPPYVGLFYDTSTLKHNKPLVHVDLSTEDGKKWFYATIRDFFSLIPPRMWAMYDGKPIVFLYSAAFAAKQDTEIFDYLRENFSRDFACKPYIVKERSWKGEADSVYAWGGAIEPKLLKVTALGPGYDHHAVPGRKPLVVDRENGKFYERAWKEVLSLPPKKRSNIVMVETWNELHEGTDICETKEYGRKYIELTKKYADMFRYK